MFFFGSAGGKAVDGLNSLQENVKCNVYGNFQVLMNMCNMCIKDSVTLLSVLFCSFLLCHYFYISLCIL